jgi:hypothetical protein
MFIFVEDAAESVASSDVEVVDLPRVRRRYGGGGRAFAMPWCGRWEL